MSEPFDPADLELLLGIAPSNMIRLAEPTNSGLNPLSIPPPLNEVKCEDDDKEALEVPKNRPVRNKMIPIHLTQAPVTEKSPFGIEDAAEHDSKVTAAFPTLVKFRGDRNAVFLIITDGPEMQDCEHDPPLLDCKNKIVGAFSRVIDNFYSETFTIGNAPKRRDPATYSTALVSLSLGHHGSPYRKQPTAVEVGACAPHIRRLILGMPNLRLVYVLGKYAEEFFVHNLDAHVMYGIAPGAPFHIHQTVSPTMASRKSYGKYGNAYIGGEASFRYYSLPWVGHRDFNSMLVSSLFRIEDTKFPLIKYPVDPRPYDISQPPLSVNHRKDTTKYFDFETFKDHIHTHLKESDPEYHQGSDAFEYALHDLIDDDEGEETYLCTDDTRVSDDDETMSSPPKKKIMSLSASSNSACPNDSQANFPSISATKTIRPVDMFVNAATDPYRDYPPNKPMYLCVRNMQFDNINNRMNLYCTTPSSSSMLVSVKNPVLSIYISPHSAFAGPGGKWYANSMLLEDSNLNFLRSFVSKKLYYKKSEYPYLLPGQGDSPVAFELVAGKHDESDGYWHERQFKFIRVDVAHYAYIDGILSAIRKLIDDANAMSSSSSSTSGRGGKGSSSSSTGGGGKGGKGGRKSTEKFKVFGLHAAEKMFIYKYRVYMSTWHRVTNLFVAPAELIETGSAEEDDYVNHSRLLNATMDFATQGTKLEFLKPSDNIPLYSEEDEQEDSPSLSSILGKKKRELPRLTSSDMPADIRAAFDIETWFERGVKDFDNTPVICICMSVRKHDGKVTQFNNKPGPDGSPATFTPKDGYHYYTFMMGKTAPPDKKTSELLGPEFLFEFYREDHLLSSFFYFKSLLMANYIQGHNSKGFDEVKLFARARMIGAEIAPQGWRQDQQTRLTVKKFQSIAKGERRQYFAEGQEGTCHVDTLQVAMNELNRNSYQLSSLSADLVGMTKHDMPYDAIKGHWTEGPLTRRTLVDYCIRDAQLPDQINTKRSTIATMCELSRVVTNVPEDRLHDEGMQVKVLGAIMYTNAEDGDQALLPTSRAWMKNLNQEIDDNITSSNKRQLDELMRKMYFNEGGKDEDDEGEKEENEVVGYRPKEPDKIIGDISVYNALEVERDGDGETLFSSLEKEGKDFPSICDDQAKANAKTEAERFKEEGGGTKRKKEVKIQEGAWDSLPNPSGTHLYRPEADADYFRHLRDGDVEKFSHKEDNRTIEQKRAEVDNALAKSQAESGSGLRRKAEYAGATVMTAHKGWYRDVPLVGVDFAALYPTIIIANNIARNTQVYEDEMLERGVTEAMCLPSPPDLIVTNPRTGKKGRVFFVRKEYRVGLMVSTEIKLLASRNVAKSLIPVFGKEFEKDGVTRNPMFNENQAEIVTQRSNGLKLVANSGYGVFGTNTENGNMHCAASVTAYGRYYIGLCKTEVERLWGGYVAGGDTDSIFVGFAGDKDGNFRFETTTEAEEFAEKVVIPTLNKLFPNPVKLDFEKTMVYFVAVAKKRYIYWLCNKGQKPYLNFKGLEIVRRDSLPFTKKTMLNCLDVLQEWPKEHLTKEQDKEWVRVRKQRAVEHIKERARSLLTGELSIGELKLSKSISREYYLNRNQEHLQVVDKLIKRNMPAPGIGDRVYFVYTKAPTPEGLKGAMKGYMIADDPEWVIRKDIPIDYDYYFKHKFAGPITSIMTHFLMDDMTELFFKKHPQKQQVTMKELTAETRRFLFDDISPSKRTRASMLADTTSTPSITTFVTPSSSNKIELEDEFEEERKRAAKMTEEKKVAAAKAAATKKRSRRVVPAKPNTPFVSTFKFPDEVAPTAPVGANTSTSSSSSSSVVTNPISSSSSSSSKQSAFAALAAMPLPSVRKGQRLVKAKADTSNNKSIAFYAQASKLVTQADEIVHADGRTEERRRPREHIQLEYENKIAAAKVALEEKTAKRDEIHKGCRACLRIGPDKPVVCKAATCKVYDVRIEAECRADNSMIMLGRLQEELSEALGVCTQSSVKKQRKQ